MKKYIHIIYISLFTIISSIVCFYSTNLILSDVSNNTYGFNDLLVFSSIPALLFSIELEILLINLIKRKFNNLDKVFLNSIFRKQSISIIILSAISILCTIYSGIFLYHSFIKPYPFSFYLIISIIVHTILLLRYAIILKKIGREKNTEKITFIKIIYSIIMSIFVFFALNRLGAFIFAFEYASTLTLNITWPFYMSLLIPIFMLINALIYRYKGFDNRKVLGLVTSSSLLLLTILLYGYTMIVGHSNTFFISAISPALPIERLITMPIDVIAQLICLLPINIYFVIYSIIYIKK